MVWKPQHRAGFQYLLGRWRYFKLWTYRVGLHKRRAGIALNCRCWCVNPGHGQGNRNSTLLTVCLELTAGTETELKSTCRWGKGAGRKPGFEGLCKTEPAATCSSDYSKTGVMASPFLSFRYRQVCKNHRIKQEGLWLCCPAVGRDRSMLSWLIP